MTVTETEVGPAREEWTCRNCGASRVVPLGDLPGVGWLLAGVSMLVTITGAFLGLWSVFSYAWLIPMPGFLLILMEGAQS